MARRVVTLVRRPDRPSLVLLPGAGGGLGPFLRLAALLSGTHAVHGVCASGLLPGEEPDRSVEAMATSALAALEAAEIAPAAVLGWSLGGVVGWELCVRLAERGCLPDLVLVDSSPVPPQEPDGHVRERVLATLGPHPAAAALEPVERTLAAQLGAIADYRPGRPYRGRVLMLSCTGEVAGTHERDAQCWRALAPRLQAGRLACDHYDVFDDDHLPELVEQLTTFLRTPA